MVAIEHDAQCWLVCLSGTDIGRRHLIKAIPGYQWDPHQSRWLLPYTEVVHEQLIAAFGKDAFVASPKAAPPPQSPNLPVPLPRGRYIRMTDNNDHPFAVLSHGADARTRLMNFLAESREQGRPAHRGRIAGHLIDKLGAASAITATTLQAGGLLQIIGTPELMEGLQTGALEHMHIAGGAISGTVLEQGSGQFAGQLRFVEASVAPIVAPVVLYQVFNAVAGIHQLEKINRRLDCLQRSVERICERMQAEDYGKLQAAIGDFDEIDRHRAIKGSFDQNLYDRLILSKQPVDQLQHKLDFVTQRFDERSETVKGSGKGHRKAYAIDQMLKEEAQEYLLDAGLLLRARQAGLYFRGLALSYYLENDPQLVSEGIERMEKQRSLLVDTVDPLARLEDLNDDAEAVRREANSVRQLWEIMKEFFGVDTLEKSVSRRRASLTKLRRESSRKDASEPTLLVFKDGERVNSLIFDVPVPG